MALSSQAAWEPREESVACAKKSLRRIPVPGCGAIFFGETLNSGAIAGGVIVLIGVALVLGVLPFQRQESKS